MMPRGGKKGKKLKESAVVDDAVTDPGVSFADSTPDVMSDEDCGLDLPEISSGVTLKRMKEITEDVRECVYSFWDAERTNEALHILELTGDYEELLVKLLIENERLRGRLEVLTSRSYTAKVASAAAKAAVRTAVNAAVPVAAPDAVTVAVPVVTTPAAIPNDVLAVATTVATPAAIPVADPIVVPTAVPTVSTAAVLPSADPIAVPTDVPAVATPAVVPVATPAAIPAPVPPAVDIAVSDVDDSEPWSVVAQGKKGANHSCSPPGVKVAEYKKIKKVIVNGVLAAISVDEFMMELFEKNLKGKMSFEVFRKSVSLGTAWRYDPDRTLNVTLLGDEKVMDGFLAVGKVFVKWFCFKVRAHDVVPHCFRCLGFGHRVRECRMRDDVCRLCGRSGHLALRCSNPVSCRNCALRGLPADHGMFDKCCPSYAAVVSRAIAGR